MTCTNCAASFDDNVRFCPKCGTAGDSINSGTAFSPSNSPIPPSSANPSASPAYAPPPDNPPPQAGSSAYNSHANVPPPADPSVYAPPAYVPPPGGVAYGVKPHNTRGSGPAIASLILGIVGAIAWLLPFIGFPVTVVGLILGVTGRKSDKKGVATAGLVLSIIFLVFTVINSIAGACLAVSGLL